MKYNHCREVSRVISRLCTDVEEGRAIGSLCREFCADSVLLPHSCQTLHWGKEIVFQASFHGNPVFVKGRRTNAYENTDEHLFWRDENNVEHFPSLEEFKEIVGSHLHHNFNISYSERVFFKLWKLPLSRDDFSVEQNNKLLKLSLETLWNLLQDSEYVFTSIFQHFDIFPEIYGTCGGLYIVEDVHPLDFPQLLERTSYSSWAGRAKLALGILDLVEELETMFDYPLYQCDVKVQHLGRSEYGRIKYVDVDNMYLKPIVDRSIGDGSSCDRHSDCDFFDCKGMCDLIQRKCLGEVTNNNLQMVCEQIFLGKSLGIKSLGGTGLLASRHGQEVLEPLLQVCANPSGAKDGTRLAADHTHLTKLRKALKEIVDFDERLKEDIL